MRALKCLAYITFHLDQERGFYELCMLSLCISWVQNSSLCNWYSFRNTFPTVIYFKLWTQWCNKWRDYSPASQVTNKIKMKEWALNSLERLYIRWESSCHSWHYILARSGMRSQVRKKTPAVRDEEQCPLHGAIVIGTLMWRQEMAWKSQCMNSICLGKYPEMCAVHNRW